MGFTPRQVDEMSPWEFMACRKGYSGNENAKPQAISQEWLHEHGVEGF